MPLNNLGRFDPRANQSISREDLMANISGDQLAALVGNIANATIASAVSLQGSSVVEKNFQDLQERLSSLSKQIEFEVDGQKLKLCVKAPEVEGNLPIFCVKDIKDITIDSPTISLSEKLPATLQKQERCVTILDLLRKELPLITQSLFKQETKIPRFVVSSPIPLNQEGKGSFFPQIVSEGQIAYIAWDSSGSQVAKGFKEKTCDILLKNKEAFCGVALSEANLEGIEKGAGVSAHFMTSKVTVIAVLVTESSKFSQSVWFDGRVACDIDSDEDNLCCDAPTRLIARGPSSKNTTTFGMLGVQGASISSNSPNLWDRSKKPRETLHLFCLEIVPQFSSENTPVDKKNLKEAIEMQLQKEIFAQFKKLNLR